MNQLCQEFLDEFRALSPTLEHAYTDTMCYWQPDLPPVTTLFGALGDQFAREFNPGAPEKSVRGFAMIEEAMSSGDEVLLTAVATGVIEAMVSRAVSENTWPVLRSQFGPSSKAHAETWASE